MIAPASPPLAQVPPTRSKRLRSTLGRVLLHCGFLVIAVACLAAYEHFSAEQQPTSSLVSLLAAAGFGFLPVRDVLRVVFNLGGVALHLVHVVGGLALVALPFMGVVSGTSVLTHAAMGPFAIMGAAQALMHSNRPRNAKQAAALQQFVAGLPAVAQLAGSKTFTSPESAARALTVVSGIVSKAQALGQTELDADPGFQSALSQVTTRFGANLGLDAVDLVLARLEANPATARAVPALKTQLAAARRALSASTTGKPSSGGPAPARG
jgi:hypothetical protein